MLLACAISEKLWTSLNSAIFCSLLAAAIVAYLTQRFVEKRERRNYRDELRLKLYLEVVDLVQDNELALAERGAEGCIPPVKLQAKRYRILHSLKLLGPKDVLDSYDTYDQLVYKSTVHPIEQRPKNPDDVVDAKNKLIELMAKEVQKN